ncbi:sigma-54-dependent transcriptional regulator [Desulfonatronum thioautotrophicum]|uniref:sigma-54-dependent transcriptional regulator n=1 Tax=Desulfonatronum thioautotrophicum TaxID=617001 RepID=UPI0005EB84B6|nr:sigma-54 dependent transcriptional regulator [Desulfonatronum thioautotrophicum]
MSQGDNQSSHCVLVVDDDPNILHLLETRLASAGFCVTTAHDGHEALTRLHEHTVDLVLSDIRMPGLSGQELLREIREQWPGLPVILLTAYGRIPEAVASVQQGAADYLTKPFDGRELVAKVQEVLAGRPCTRPQSHVSSELTDIGLVAGQSPAMAKLLTLVKRVAPSDVTVLLEGESGTGKELVARLLHRLSKRANGPLVVVDCGSTQPTLLESELFGHIKGAFTHAMQEKQGLIQAANEGTLFLDEIGNISMEMQTRLLRFLQEKTVRRLGDVHTTKVNCRVVAATNADLAAMVAQGTFREDLYYRLKVVRVHVPPLRDRREDIPALAQYFLASFSRQSDIPCPGLSEAALHRLEKHSWPGNVRELRHVLEVSALLSDNPLLSAENLHMEPSTQQPEDTVLSLDESERNALVRALKHVNWVQKDAADLLGISRRAMHYKVRKYGIDIPKRGEKF